MGTGGGARCTGIVVPSPDVVARNVEVGEEEPIW